MSKSAKKTRKTVKKKAVSRKKAEPKKKKSQLMAGVQYPSSEKTPETFPSIKRAYCFPENYKYGLSQTSGLLMLNDIQTGWPVAIMDAIWITAKRTPLVTSLAVEKLARKNSTEVGILGCGVQGREHVPALAQVMPAL